MEVRSGSACSGSPSPPGLPREAAASPAGPQHRQLCPHDRLPSSRLGSCAASGGGGAVPAAGTGRWTREGTLDQGWVPPLQAAPPEGPRGRDSDRHRRPQCCLQARVPAPRPETTVWASVSPWSDAEGVSREALPRPRCLVLSAAGLEPCSPGGCGRGWWVLEVGCADQCGVGRLGSAQRPHTDSGAGVRSCPGRTLVTMCPAELSRGSSAKCLRPPARALTETGEKVSLLPH